MSRHSDWDNSNNNKNRARMMTMKDDRKWSVVDQRVVCHVSGTSIILWLHNRLIWHWLSEWTQMLCSVNPALAEPESVSFTSWRLLTCMLVSVLTVCGCQTVGRCCCSLYVCMSHTCTHWLINGHWDYCGIYVMTTIHLKLITNVTVASVSLSLSSIRF